jgi:alkylation response protein AidB-like acyl-CoA dehydrogenase/putative sterol carrier protein
MKSVFFTEEHISFRAAVRQFIDREVASHAEEWEREERIPRYIWHLMADNDLLGISYPEEYGGSGADFLYSVVFLEELARSTMGGFVAAVGVHQYIAMSYIEKFGSRFLKENYLRPGILGEKIGALAITEPNTGSDVAALRTRAVREGDFYIINGSKTFITNGVYCDFIVLAAKTNPEAEQSGISLFVVDKNLPGVNTRQLQKIGWHASDTAEISFDEVKVPATHLVGEENMGFYYIMECFQSERLVAAITAIAGADYCLKITLNYLHEREAFKKPLAKFQVIRHNFSDLATELEAARQLTYYACWLYNEGIPAVQQCTMAKLYATELAKKIADTCLQYFGGYGYMDDYLISRIYRDARVGTIVGGTSEIMREIIAKLIIDDMEYRKLENVDTQAEESSEPPKVEETLSPEGDNKELEIDRQVEDLLANNTATPPPGSGFGSPMELPDESRASEEEISDQQVEDFEAEVLAEEEVSEEGTADKNHSEQTATSEENFMAEEEKPSSMENILQKSFETDLSKSQTMVDKIIYSLPERFQAENAGDLETVVHFKISGNDGGEYTVAIKNGECVTKSGLTGQPRCMLETSAKTYIDMETGRTNPQIAFMMGKVRISNIPEMMQFIKLFNKLPDT